MSHDAPRGIALCVVGYNYVFSVAVRSAAGAYGGLAVAAGNIALVSVIIALSQLRVGS